MLIKIVDEIKQQFQSSVDSSISEIKGKLGSDILNIELTLLYLNKIYGKEAYILQNKFAELSLGIDNILNIYKVNCINSVIELLDEIVNNEII